MLLLLLTACDPYSCGDYRISGDFGEVQAGEWCGLYGSYGFHYLDSDQLQLILEPGSADDEINALRIHHLAITELRFPYSALEQGAVLSADDFDSVVCGVAPQGAGSGSLTFVEASDVRLEVGRPTDKTLVGDFAWTLDWQVTCEGNWVSEASGSDTVEFTEQASE
ncbi:MAG: hypothetical protein VX899_15890 [Myxococcota bacterium]|nr:hypothetical protein [Myxococcota bacterium]